MGNSISSESSSVQSVDRALQILEILALKGETSVTDIATELEIHKSTASRLLTALLSRDLVEQISDRGKYRLGMGLVRLAGTVSSNLDSVSGSRSITRALADQYGETVNIAVLDENRVLYVDQVAGSHIMTMTSFLGQSVPIHCTATGKVLVAWLDDVSRKATFPTKFEKLTRRTISSAAEFEKELAKVRDRGYAIADEEMEDSFTAVAAPIRDSHHEVVAALVVSGPTVRMTKLNLDLVGQNLIKSAKKLSGNPAGWRE
jgi:DNA-binding IclR family transcriptional regulator